MNPAPVWVVLPAFNEASGLPALLEAIERTRAGAAWQVVVVDDGSTDATAAVVRERATRAPVTLLSHPRNQGLGVALRTGLEHVCREASPEAVVVTMDADNTHAPEQIPAMVAAIRHGADVVIASRYLHGARQAGVPPHRVALSAGVGWLLRVRFGLPGVRDYSCGYRAYRAEILQRAVCAYGPRLIESRGFVVMTELLVKLAPMRPRIAEVPLDLRYDRKVGASKMPAGSTIAGYLRLVLAAAPRPGRPE
jgi:dolichol-phosphate mannosyltransferase